MKKIKIFLSFTLIFLGSLLFSFLFLFSICSVLNDFGLINAKTTLLFSAIMSIVISILMMVLIFINAHSKRTSKLLFWLGQRKAKIILATILLFLFSRSIRNEILWTAREIPDVLSIIWTIFGLSITIFLVWNVLIVGYLKSKQPVEKNDSDLIEHYQYLISKNSFAQDVKTLFNTVVLLVINLFLILIATSSVYLSKAPESLLTQNITIFAFYVSTNTLISLFFDILKPLQKDQEELIDQNQVSLSEIQIAEIGAKLQTNIETVAKIVNDNPHLSEKQKKELIALFCDTTISCLKDNKEVNLGDNSKKIM